MENFKTDWRKLPNIVTFFRLLLCPFPGIILYFGSGNLNYRILAAVLFLIISMTDLLDGYLARSRNEITELGKFLDPLVDKLLAGLTLVFLSLVSPIVWYLTIFVLIRETFVAWMLYRAKQWGMIVKVNFTGKAKTVVLAIVMTLLFLPLDGNLILAVAILTYIAFALSLLSAYEYYLKYYTKIIEWPEEK